MKQSTLLAPLFTVALVSAAHAQQVPARPPGMSDQQIQAAIQDRGLGDLLRQRITQSGLTPDQIRARLRAAGYSESLVDAYLGNSPGSAPVPSLDVLRAASALGLADFAIADSATVRHDTSATTARAESLAGPAAVFGLEVFHRNTNQFAPVTSGPVDPEYRLGAGDEIVLILTGDVEAVHQLPVSREGFIVIPQVGQLQVANLTMSQLRTLLFQRLGRVYSGVRQGAGATTRFDLTLSRVRVNQVFVVGEVARPGAYAVSAVGTVLNALYSAGGPTERGSFRGIRIQRAGQLVITLDLYDYLLNGNTRNDIRLESGDVVFVPPNHNRVLIEGLVLRPAIYELLPGQGLRDLVQLAGGLLPQAYTGRATIERVLPPDQRLPGGRDRVQLDVSLADVLASGAPAVMLRPDDRVGILGITDPVRNRVTVRGNVWHPGGFELTPGLRFSGLIVAAGGLRSDTYLDRAHILRLMPDSTRRLIPVDLRPVARGAPGSPAIDPELQEFDEVTIFSRTEFRPSRQIAVYGSVQHPGSFAFRDSMTLRDVLLVAGGLSDDAYLLEAEIARVPMIPGGDTLATIIRVPLDSSYVLDPTGYIRRPAGSLSPTLLLQPYDNVLIRRVPGFSLQRYVVVAGEVLFPGRYAITRPDERISDLLNRAGGLTPAAYAHGTQFYRAENRAGRVGIDFERLIRDPSFRDNLVLLAGDSLFVPQYQPVVIVEGSVNSPVAVAYVPNQNAGYYVNRAGGYTRLADQKRTYTVQANGSVVRRTERVDPGARVVVPSKPETQGTSFAQIISTVATVIATLMSVVVVATRL